MNFFLAKPDLLPKNLLLYLDWLLSRCLITRNTDSILIIFQPDWDKNTFLKPLSSAKVNYLLLSRRGAFVVF